MVDAGKRLVAKVALAVEQWAHGVYDSMREPDDDELLMQLNDRYEQNEDRVLLFLDLNEPTIVFVSQEHPFRDSHRALLLAAAKKLHGAAVDAARAERNNEEASDEG